MPWKRAMFKDSKVWVEVDDAGRIKAASGRVPIRYTDGANAKVYQAGAAGVTILAGDAVSLPDAAPAAPSGGAAGGGGGQQMRGFGKAGTRTDAQAAAARTAAREMIAAFHREAVLCFTDGACQGNPGPAGSGAVVKLPDGRVAERKLALGRATNNIAELSAIKLALEALDDLAVPSDSRIEILTDSQYAHGLLTLGWKGKANQDLIASIRAKLKNFPRARVHWIAGHVGVAENERADQLANAGVAESGRR